MDTIKIKTMEKLIGKTIVGVKSIQLKDINKDPNNYPEWIYDDEFLEITCSDGDVFYLEGSYGGYTGESMGEYPSSISCYNEDEFKKQYYTYDLVK